MGRLSESEKIEHLSNGLKQCVHSHTVVIHLASVDLCSAASNSIGCGVSAGTCTRSVYELGTSQVILI